jgi:hypothetical protein
MKKVLLVFAVLMVALTASAQLTSKGKPTVLNSFRMGNCKLIEIGSMYKIESTVKENTDLKMNIELGTKEEAIKLIESLIEYEPAKGEIVSLNNPTNNTAEYKSMQGGWQFYISGMKAHSSCASKGELKKMLKSLKEK